MTRLSKFFTNFIKITGFLCFSLPCFASSDLCMKFYKKPNIKTTIDYGNVLYKSVSKDEIIKIGKLPNPKKTIGLTVADFKIKYDFDFDRHKVDNGVCVNFSQVNFFVGYENLDVLIDNKYPIDSCEYKAIKNHEKGHIKIYQKELKYYGTLLLEELKNIIENLPPIYFSKVVSEKILFAKLDEIIANNENILVLKNKLESSILNLNKEYDNAVEYQRVNSQCNGW